ncbi:MAG: flagellar protein FlgN [Synergistaceae bacterium]|nr:flagellar protein FlgN [Synergistaceae bacterium]
MPTDFFNTLSSLVQEELSLYKSLELLVNDEEARVSESDMEGLLDVLKRKQAIISRQEDLLERWNKISESLGISDGREGPAFWDSIAVRIGESGYNQIIGSIKDIREIGQKLLHKEGEIRKALEEHLAEMRATLLKMGRNRAAMKSYSQGMTAY